MEKVSFSHSFQLQFIRPGSSTMLGALLLLFLCGVLADGIFLHSRWYSSPIDIIFSRPGDSACSNSQALVPVSVSMSSVRKKKLGSDKCADGDLETLCTTKKKPFSTITLDFGKPVEIGKVPTVFAKLSIVNKNTLNL